MNIDTNKREALKDVSIKMLAAIGLVAVLAFATWGAVQVSVKAPGALSNLSAAVANITLQFFPSEEAEELTFSMATRNAISEKPFTFSWIGDESAAYTFSYECRDGLTFETPGSLEGNRIVPCATPFSFVNTTNTLTLIPNSSENRFLDVEITVATLDGLASGSTLVTVVNESITDDGSDGATEAVSTTPLQPRTETEVVGGGTPIVSDPNGKPDLIGYLLAVGYIDESTKQFVASSSIARSEKVAVRFEVRNIGTKDSGIWNFKADLPTSPSHTYEPRQKQQSLAPSERIEYTLSFDRARRGAGSVIINIDPSENLDEFTRVNNRVEAALSII